jgi:hypothetical protein
MRAARILARRPACSFLVCAAAVGAWQRCRHAAGPSVHHVRVGRQQHGHADPQAANFRRRPALQFLRDPHSWQRGLSNDARFSRFVLLF